MNYSSVPDQSEVGHKDRSNVVEVTDDLSPTLTFEGHQVFLIPRNPNYGVTKDGRVLSIARTHKTRGGGERMSKNRWLKPLCTTQQRYFTVSLSGIRFLIHRLVIETFVGPIPKDKVVDHVDRDRFNNHIENLRVVSRCKNSLNRDCCDKIKTSKTTSGYRSRFVVETQSPAFATRSEAAEYGRNHMQEMLGKLQENLDTLVEHLAE